MGTAGLPGVPSVIRFLRRSVARGRWFRSRRLRPARGPCLGAILLWVGACGGGASNSQAQCEALLDPEITDPEALDPEARVARENCLFERVSTLYPDQPEAFRKALEAIAEPESRDLVRLRLAIEDPLRASELCRQVETAAAERKCRQVLGRPHLRSRPQPPRKPPDPEDPAEAPAPSSESP